MVRDSTVYWIAAISGWVFVLLGTLDEEEFKKHCSEETILRYRYLTGEIDIDKVNNETTN